MKIKPASPEAVKLFHDGAIALAEIEHGGIKIDTDYVRRAHKTVTRQIKELAESIKKGEVWKQWVQEYGPKAELSKLPQLAHILYDLMGYPCRDRTAPTEKFPLGQASVDSNSLRRITEGKAAPFVGDFLKMRRLEKVKVTYLEGILKETIDGYMHPDFNLHTVRTYRSSSSKPNWHNLPVRDESSSKWVRRAVVSRHGNRGHIGEIDFKGIEVGMAGIYHKDPNWLEYVRRDPGRMHTDIAAQLYGVEVKQVSKKARYCAKNMFVFPEFYGSYWAQCAPNLWEAISKFSLMVEGTETSLKDHLRSQGIKKLGRVDKDTGKPEPGTFVHRVWEVERDFWDVRFPVYTQWKRDWYDAYCRKGWFRMKTGFVVSLCRKRNDVLNYPIQGSAFHCLLWTLIRLHRWLKKHKMKTRIIGQIHDSINFDSPKGEVQDFLNEATRIIAEDLPKEWPWIIVPLQAECEVAPAGESWYTKQPWVREKGVWAPEEAA